VQGTKTLKTGTLVDRVTFSKNAGSDEIRATGVEVIDSPGKKHTFTIRRG